MWHPNFPGKKWPRCRRRECGSNSASSVLLSSESEDLNFKGGSQVLRDDRWNIVTPPRSSLLLCLRLGNVSSSTPSSSEGRSVLPALPLLRRGLCLGSCEKTCTWMARSSTTLQASALCGPAPNNFIFKSRRGKTKLSFRNPFAGNHWDSRIKQESVMVNDMHASCCTELLSM